MYRPRHAERSIRPIMKHLNTKSELDANVDISGCFVLAFDMVDSSGNDIPILTTFENCTAFSAAVCRSSMLKIFKPLSLI